MFGVINFACLTLSFLSSCNQIDADQVEEMNSKEVTFSLSTFEVSQEAMTRANDSIPVGYVPSHLLVLDVVNGEVKQTFEKTTDSLQVTTGVTKVSNVLENLKMTLSYGNHDIYFLAADVPYASYDKTNKTVSWSADHRLHIAWAKKVSVTVSQTTASTQSVDLPLAVGCIALVCNDAQDSAASKMQISGNLFWTLALTTMKGLTTQTVHTYSIKIPDKNPGKTFSSFSFEPTSGSSINMTYTALDTAGNAIVSHTLTNVPLSVGVYTRYKGDFYSITPLFTLSVANAWTEIEDLTY